MMQKGMWVVLTVAVALTLGPMALAREHPLRSIVGREPSLGIGVGLDKLRMVIVGAEGFPSQPVAGQEEQRLGKMVARERGKTPELVAQERFAPGEIVAAERFIATPLVTSEESRSGTLVARSRFPSEGLVGVEQFPSKTLVTTEPSLWGTSE